MTAIHHHKPELCKSFSTEGESSLKLLIPSAWFPALGVGLKDVPEPQGQQTRLEAAAGAELKR